MPHTQQCNAYYDKRVKNEEMPVESLVTEVLIHT